MKKFVLALTVAILSISFAFAQNADAKRFALVIGNQAYDESPLANPRADSKLISEALKECGFDVTLAQDLESAGFIKVVADYADKVAENGGENTISFFYYSGHGLQIGGKNYMVPTNDKDITSETKAKGKCYSIDTLLELVPSSTQVVVLDACRNNPFKTSKGSFTKGLTRISAPKHVINFQTLFSTGDGQTADDGTGRNSLFTECLNKRMREFNTPVLTVFNEVADDVKSSTGGRQTPLIAGSSVKFEFMNAKIAENRIKELQNAQKALELDKTKKASKEYDSEKKLLAAEIAMMQDQKVKAEKDATEKAAKKRAEDAQRRNNQKEMERQQREAEKSRKAFQAAKAKEKNSLTFIKEIEDNKERIQKIRTDAATKIYAAQVAIQKDADSKKDAIWNAELKITEKDAKGKMNSDTQKKRKAEMKLIQDDAETEKKKNHDRFYETIQEEETERVAQLAADEKTLTGAKYEMSSFMKEVDFEVNGYDGESNKWVVKYTSNFMGNKSLFNGEIEITYEQLCKQILQQPYVDPKKKMGIEYDQYNEDIELYDGLFRSSNSPINVVVEYKMKPSTTGISCYEFSTVSVAVKYMKDTEEIVLNQKPLTKTAKIQWEEKQTEIKTVDKLIAGYKKEDDAKAKAAAKAEKEKAAKEKAEAQKASRPSGSIPLDQLFKKK